jgi:hypothetical protein
VRFKIDQVGDIPISNPEAECVYDDKRRDGKRKTNRKHTRQGPPEE